MRSPSRTSQAAAAQRQAWQDRRLQAAELFAHGQHPAQVARTLGVSRQSASRWHAAWTAGGTSALASKGPSGPPPRLSDHDLERVRQALLDGATAHGFTGDLWTLGRITTVIQRPTGVAYHPGWVWVILRERLAGACNAQYAAPPSGTKPRSKPGWRRIGPGSRKRPQTQSPISLLRRVGVEHAAQRAPYLGAGGPATRAGPPLQLERASMAAALCYGVGGGGCSLCFHVQAGNYDTTTLIGVIGQLRRFLGGEKAEVPPLFRRLLELVHLDQGGSLQWQHHASTRSS
jgi:transposase